jgi:O-antigen/teichoic acid export membrane protein
MTGRAGEPPRTAVPPGTRLGTVLARNTLTNFAGQAILAVLVLLATPYVVSRLGSARYGVLMLVLTFVGFLGVLQLGLNAGLVRYLAPLLQAGRAAEVGAYLRSALAVFVVLGALAGALAAGLGYWLTESVFDIPAEMRAPALAGVYIASAALMLRFPGEALAAVAIAAQRFDLVNLSFLGAEAFRVVASVAAVAIGYRIEGVCTAILLSNVVFLAAGLACARHLVPGVSLRPSFRHGPVRELLHFSKYVMLASVSGRVVHTLDKAIIGYLLPVRFVAYYDLPYSLSQKLWAVVGNVTSVVFPAASALSSQSGAERLRQLYLRSSKVVAALACGPALMLCLFSREVLLHWVGPEFAAASAGVLAMVSLAFLFNCLAHVPSLVAQALGRPQISARFSALNAASNLLLLFVLVPPFGIAGAAAGFLATQIAFAPWFAQTANRLVGVRFAELAAGAYRPVLAASLAATALWLLVRPWAGTLGGLALAVAVCGAGYLGVLVLVGLDAAERDTCRSLLGLTGRLDARRA